MIVGQPGDNFRQLRWRAKYFWAPEHNNTFWINNLNQNFNWSASGPGFIGDVRGLRLRFLIQWLGAGSTTKDFALRRSFNDGSYIGVTALSALARLTENRVLVHHDPTTDFFGRLGDGVYVASNTGQMESVPATTGNITFQLATEVELEFSIKIIDPTLVQDDRLKFRIYLTGNDPLEFYTQTPEITVDVIPGNPPAQTALDFKTKTSNAVYVDFGSRKSILADIKSTPSILFSAEGSKSIDVDIESKPSIIVSPGIH
jgi:hypothetical protein